MHAQSLLSFALVAFTSSTVLADEVATLLLPEMYGQDLVGKVIGTDGPLTTYVINCHPTPENQDFQQVGDCDISSQGWTVTGGPSTIRAVFDYSYYNLKEDCSLISSTSLSCALTMEYGSSTEVNAGGTVGPASNFYQTVTITGTELVSGSASAQNTPTATHATATPTDTATGTTSATPTVTGSGSGQQKAAANTESSTPKASQSTNAAPAIVTGNAKWAFGGAAAMAVIAMA
ncbi:hypothetical protein ANOM_006582 [Aspergillus nomiae NRRL 13137]|uniref:GPI anchored glycoprotein n=1 Tax=Aspergillus nomiae NRRL (strain ATCC 15546 / NRRL 13137 / CBS 260.88 / M93) TaxID=1509407 RepID=A0A0L1J2Y1_ASPN3|nr:uncharacterized protein ANOM_006582 [Aspergillus nomiae NRRL 13137]KNG86166.1 hypothetical protein ANOM_006582 [Aspergillus nomiae NRRL 13137]